MTHKSSYPTPNTYNLSPVAYIHKLTLSLLFLLSFFALGLFSLCILNSPATAGWQVERIPNLGDAGSGTLAFDVSGNPAIAYSVIDTNELKLAYFNVPNPGWNFIIISNSGGDHSLVLDPSGNPALSYIDNHYLKYARFNVANLGWNISTVIGPSPIVSFDPNAMWKATSLAFDKLGNPAIATQGAYGVTCEPRGPLGSLRYFHFNVPNPGWNQTLIADACIPRLESWHYYPSLAFDASGNPNIAYCDSPNSALKYAHFNGSTWDIITIDPAWCVSPSLDFDKLGKPAISYLESNNLALKFARFNGRTWDITIVDTGIMWGGSFGYFSCL